MILKKMKCTIPEISWHNREPVLSVDIHSVSDEFYKLASSGVDSHILIWQMTIDDNGAVKQELISDLTRHQKAVNIVRWSPSGQYLASADDDANIIIWQLKTDNIPLLEGDTGDKEIWNVYKVLRGHKEDIYDICWSPSNLKLFSGSIDNTAILWDITKGKMDHILSDHKGFVQGVAWDPKNQIIASISTDRICRIFDISGKQVKARILKGKLPISSDHVLYEKEVKYFHDDTFKSFFRRLQFSPEGSLLIVPSGHMEDEDCKRTLNATLIFTLDNMNEPVALLPHGRQCSTVIRCCPVLFELREDGPDPLVKLPYRMIFAIGTDHDVILYDTQQRVPFARLQDIHYTRMTDLTWSSDGLLLVASSTDGFCALITFEPEELGVPYVKEESEEEDNTVLDPTALKEVLVEKDENIDLNKSIDNEVKETEMEKKKPSFIEKWASSPQPKPRRLKPTPVSSENSTVKSSGNKGDNVSDCSAAGEIITIEDENNDLNKKTEAEIKDPGKKRPSLIEKWSASSQLKPKRLKPIPVDDKNEMQKKSENDSSTNIKDCDVGKNQALNSSLEKQVVTEQTISKENGDKNVKETENNQPNLTETQINNPQPKPRRLKPIPVYDRNDRKNNQSKADNVSENELRKDENVELISNLAVTETEKTNSNLGEKIDDTSQPKPKRLKPIPVGEKIEKMVIETNPEIKKPCLIEEINNSSPLRTNLVNDNNESMETNEKSTNNDQKTTIPLTSKIKDKSESFDSTTGIDIGELEKKMPRLVVKLDNILTPKRVKLTPINDNEFGETNEENKKVLLDSGVKKKDTIFKDKNKEKKKPCLLKELINGPKAKKRVNKDEEKKDAVDTAINLEQGSVCCIKDSDEEDNKVEHNMKKKVGKKGKKANLNKSITKKVEENDSVKKQRSFIEQWVKSPQSKAKRLKPIPVSDKTKSDGETVTIDLS